MPLSSFLLVWLYYSLLDFSSFIIKWWFNILKIIVVCCFVVCKWNQYRLYAEYLYMCMKNIIQQTVTNIHDSLAIDKEKRTQVWKSLSPSVFQKLSLFLNNFFHIDENHISNWITKSIFITTHFIKSCFIISTALSIDGFFHLNAY